MTAQTAGCRIWHLLDSRAIGGIETHVIALAVGQRAAGADARVVLLADHGDHPMTTLLAERDRPLETLDGRLTSLLRGLKRGRPAILHTHGYKAGILGRLAGRLTGVPVVSTFHNGDDGTGKLRAYTALDRFTARLARRIAVNPAIADRLPGGATVVGNGVPVPGVEAVSCGDRVAFVGRLSHEKGPDTFLELARRLPQLSFDMFGDGAMRDEIADRAGAVALRGAVPSMDPHWRDVGLLVMPSRAEGLPMAALEAMARGIPVAAFDVGALARLTDDDRGWCVPTGDLEALAGAVTDWAGETPMDRMARRGRNRRFVQAHHSVERMVVEIDAIYREMA
jgi:glycosyltransferase involved in cell wall biosynthesis